MKYQFRITQNKETKSSEAKKNQELRQENQRLRKSNARLRKDLEKFQNSIYRVEEPGPEEEHIPASLERCKQCASSDLKKVNLGVRMMTFCNECGWRKAE